MSGPGATAFLQRLSANDVDRATGTVIYTQMLNARGGIECDLTVTRLEDDRFLLVTGHRVRQPRHRVDPQAARRRRDDAVTVRDVTGSLGCFGLWGPRARDVLSGVTPDDLSNDGVPVHDGAREIVVGDVPCLALRVTYVGELGWELYPHVEFAGALWDTLVAAGEPLGMLPAGYRAIDSLRLEKGYRAWGSDITPEEHPFEAGLGFAVRMDVPGFIGNEALERVQAGGVTRRLSCLTLSDAARDDARQRARVPRRRRGLPRDERRHRLHGRRLDRLRVPARSTWRSPGTAFEVEVFGERVPATVADEPLWDPKGERIRS